MNRKRMELNDDELDLVTGGTGQSAINAGTCNDFMCCWCGEKFSAGEKNHACKAQSGIGTSSDSLGPTQWVDTYIENVCNECEHQFSCPQAKG